MAEFSALPLFTDSLVADTAHLTDTEFGRYMRLLILCWRSPECRIPNDKEWISKRLHLNALQFDGEIRPLLEEFFQDYDSGNAYAYANACKWISQKRLIKEWMHVKDKVKKNKSAAKSRWNKEKISCERICERNAPSPSPSPTYIRSDFLNENVDKRVDKVEMEFHTESLINEKALQRAKDYAPGWDMYHLMRLFDEKVNNGDFERPKSVNGAFPAWCKSFTKGKRPD